MGIIANDIEGIADSQLYELLLDQFGSGIQGRRLRSEALVDVRDLVIVNTQINDLSFLRFFPNLVTLDVHANALESLNGLGYARKLRRLKVSDNPLVSIEDLQECPRIEVLDISDVTLRDVTPIAYLCD